MEIFLLSFAGFAIAIAGMAIGVLFGKPGIKGSCGGLKTIQGLESDCLLCSSPCQHKHRRADTNTERTAR